MKHLRVFLTYCDVYLCRYAIAGLFNIVAKQGQEYCAYAGAESDHHKLLRSINNMVKAAGIKYRPRWIQRFCYRKPISQHGIFLSPARSLKRHVKRFIEGTPANNGRMIKISRQSFHPLRQKARKPFCSRNVQTPIATFTPYHISQTIGMVQHSLFKHFYVRACSIETKSLSRLNITDQGSIILCGINPVRIKTLVYRYL